MLALAVCQSSSERPCPNGIMLRVIERTPAVLLWSMPMNGCDSCMHIHMYHTHPIIHTHPNNSDDDMSLFSLLLDIGYFLINRKLWT